MDVHDAELDKDGRGNEQGRVMCCTSRRTATVALRVPSGENLYLAVRKGYILKSVTRRLEAVIDCFVACCSPDKKSIEMLKWIVV